MAGPADDPVVKRFTRALRDIDGDRLDRVVLFGARGEAAVESHYDVAAFRKTVSDKWEERRRLAGLRQDFLDATDAFFDSVPLASERTGERTPLMHAIRRDGIML